MARPGTPVFAIALALLTLVPSAVAAQDTLAGQEIRLTMAPGISMANATIFAGSLGIGQAPLEDLVVLDAGTLVIGPGDLVACPRENGAQRRVPAALRALEGPCRGGTIHTDPSIRFGFGTTVRVEGSFDVEHAPEASLSLFSPLSTGQAPWWVTTMGATGIGLKPTGTNFTFYAVSPGASIIIDSGNERYQYNETEFRFTFEDATGFQISGGGLVAQMPRTFGMSLEPADDGAFRDVLHPFRLLELQGLLLGVDAREPVRNLTAVMGNFTRVPSLLNGAILGRLNGSFGSATFTSADSAMVRVPAFTGGYGGGEMTGTGTLAFSVSSAGFAAPGEDPETPPWLTASLLWLITVAAWVIIPRPETPPRDPALARMISVAVFPVAFVVWDLLVADALGVSAGALWMAGEPRGSIAAFVAVQTAALIIGWLLVALPVRFAASRVLARFAPRAFAVHRYLGVLSFLVVAFVWPFALLGLAFMIVRL